MIFWFQHQKGQIYLIYSAVPQKHVYFLTKIHKRHPITRPLEQGVGCLLWIQCLMDILPQFLQLYRQYLIILDPVIIALNCNNLTKILKTAWAYWNCCWKNQFALWFEKNGHNFCTFVMSPSHRRECCLRTNTNWHSLRIAQHRIDSNYFVLVRCNFRISSQPNTNVLKCSKHSYWPCESILFVLRRIASPNVVSIRASSCWFVSHRCTFVSIRCPFALVFAACLLRLSTLQYDAQRLYCRIGSHMFALVRMSSY